MGRMDEGRGGWKRDGAGKGKMGRNGWLGRMGQGWVDREDGAGKGRMGEELMDREGRGGWERNGKDVGMNGSIGECIGCMEDVLGVWEWSMGMNESE